MRSLVDGRSVSREVAFLEGSSGEVLTWADLASAAEEWERVAGKLGPDRRTGLQVGGALDMVGAFVGAVAAHVTVAPLDPDAPHRELVGKIRALGLSSLVVDKLSEASERAARECGVALWQWQSGRLVRLTKGSHPAKAEAGSAALILSSSGTTGRPKLIPLTEEQLLHTARQVVAAHELTSEDRGYSPLPLFHINALVVAVLSTLLTGGSMVVDRRFSASAFWGVVERNRVTWINLVPGILGALANRPAPAPEVAAKVGFARSASA
ncbi:MAG: AMP-binding protein, partial [Acidimicrobiales bacterium]